MTRRRRTYPPDVVRDEGHEPITWSQFDRSGLIETQRSGLIWSPAPAIKGGRAYWVVPDDRDHNEPWVIAVTVIGRRRQIGRAGSDRYRPTGGRVIDQGEAISEAHPDSPTGSLTAFGSLRLFQARAITVPAIPQWMYDVLSSAPR